MSKIITVIPGDGIGPEVTDATLEVLAVEPMELPLGRRRLTHRGAVFGASRENGDRGQLTFVADGEVEHQLLKATPATAMNIAPVGSGDVTPGETR